MKHALITGITGQDGSYLAEMTASIVGYEGKIMWDSSKPDGTPQKLLDVSRLNQLDWKTKISLEQGIAKTYAWYAQSI